MVILHKKNKRLIFTKIDLNSVESVDSCCQEKGVRIVTFTNVKPSSVQTTGNPGPSGENRKTEEESFALGQTISKGKRHLIQRHSSFFLLFDPLFRPFTV